MRCFVRASFLLVAICVFWSARVYAESGPQQTDLMRISPEFWLGIGFTVLFSLLAGYAKSQDNRIRALEHETKQQQSQLNLLRETVLREHPTKAETSEHRAHVEEQLTYLRTRIDDLVEAIMNQRRR